MNRRLLVILLIALVVASVSSYLIVRMVGNNMNASKSVPSTPMIVAARDIKIGTILAAADVKVVNVTGIAPQGAITQAKDAIGRGAISNIYNGELVLDSRLAPMGSGGGLAATIKQGMRACAVKVDEVVGVAGFVTPGMRVDVLVSGVPPNSTNNQETQTRTLLQNIEVLSAGTDIQKDAEGKPQQVQVVNLLVSPEDAQILSLAANQMKIQLVLRNPLDTTINTVKETQVTNLFGGTGQAKPVSTVSHKARPAAAQPFTITVVNGDRRSEAKFASTGGQQ
ncbi:MAG: Flp pilus assembly protein CpaB [Terracidiphilus sp.]|nr:Flp pilus assembly protein CpaB [Terracidiphilus sp.]